MVEIPNLAGCFDFHDVSIDCFASTVIEAAITNTLEGKIYEASRVKKDVDAMNKFIVENMTKACGNFKYISSILISQNEAVDGKQVKLKSNLTASWDVVSDHSVDVTWSSDAMTCVVTLIGVLI